MQHNDLGGYLFGREPLLSDEAMQKTEHRCERCQRPCGAKFRYCYRCHNYLRVKARLTSEQH